MNDTVATTYGFIGLGQLGYGMTKNIRLRIPPSSQLAVYDVKRQTVNKFIEEQNGVGVKAASSPKEIAEIAVGPSQGLKTHSMTKAELIFLKDVIMTSVPQAPHVKDVFLNSETGLLAAKPRHRLLFLELSTIDAEESMNIAKKVVSEGRGDFIDAPCSGGAMGAESGALSFMIGCSDALYPRVFEICKLMGSEGSIFHCGELGSGLKIKLLNNYLSALTAMATAEVYNIGLRGGLDARKLHGVINASSGMTPNNAASKGYVGGFSLELCLGVLELGYKAAEDVEAKTVLGKPMLEAFRDAAKDERFQGKDSKIIYKWLGGEDPVLS